MREWVFQAEHILDGSWATTPADVSNAEVGRRFDAWLAQLRAFVEGEQRTDDERLRLGHLLKVLSHLRPGLIQCYDRTDFPRTNNDLERTIRAIKMHYRRISGRKNWNVYLLRYGRCVSYQEWWQQQPHGTAQLAQRFQQVEPRLWREVRQQTRDRQQEQLNRYRFRHRPLTYLAALETRWKHVTCT